MSRRFTASDRLVDQFDSMLRTLVPGARRASRPCPGADTPSTLPGPEQRRRSIEVLRYCHRARIMGQGLYQGQRLAGGPARRYQPVDALAVRGIDHLVWCETRLTALDGRAPRLAPLYYAKAFAIGAALGHRGRAVGLGVLHASEQQQAGLMERQWRELAGGDPASGAILRRMLEDNTRHARGALEAGGKPWPEALRWTLSFKSRLCEKCRLGSGALVQ